jgi:hypothetical protein
VRYAKRFTWPGVLFLLVAVLALACGSGSSSGGSGAPGNASSGGSGSGGGGASGSGSGSGSTSSGGGSGGGTGDDGGVVPDDSGPPNSTQSLTLTIGPFTVPAGGEVYKCQTFANPFGGKDTDIAAYEEHMTLGSHHMFLFFMPGATDGALEDCPNGGFEYHPYPFSAQQKDATLAYPQGVGSRIPGSMGLMLNAHFLNTTATDYQATLTVTLHLATPGSIQQYAGVVFMDNVGISIPPTNQPVTVSATCNLTQDMNVMLAASHMHTRATEFVAATPSQKLYQTNIWADPPPETFSPVLQLTKGTPVTFSCTYVNDTSQTLTFGESATSNVMCIYTMQFYPVADPSNPTITCQML